MPDALPAFVEPFVPLAEAIERVISLTLPAATAFAWGHTSRATALFREAIEFSSQPNIAGLSADDQRDAVHPCRYAVGAAAAAQGSPEALAIAAELERDEAWVTAGWMVRLGYALGQGNATLADDLQARIELRFLERRARPPLAAVGARASLIGHVLADDTLGMQQTIPALTDLATLHDSFRPDIQVARANIARVRRDHETSLRDAELALSMMREGKHSLWSIAAACRIHALRGLGQLERAQAEALRAAGVTFEGELGNLIQIEVGLSMAALGDYEGSAARLDAIIAHVEAIGEGVYLGLCWEARARLAIAMQDRATFNRCLARCDEQYGRQDNSPALAAKRERLLHEARSAGLLREAPARSETRSTLEFGIATGTRRPLLEQCANRGERVERTLELLMREAGASGGQLYLVQGGRLELATTRGTVPESDLLPVVQRMLGDVSTGGGAFVSQTTRAHGERLQPGEQDDDETVIATTVASMRWARGSFPLLLQTAPEAQVAVTVGAAVLHFDAGVPVQMPFSMSRALATALLEQGDTEPH